MFANENLTLLRTRDDKSIVNEVTTLRRHLEAYHVGKYRKWAEENNFESRLPGDIRRCKAAAAELVVRTLDRDLVEKKITERIVKYTDQSFRQTAIEWLIATDQPICALEHPKFKEMIDIAACATNRVKLPGRKSTRAEIIRLFKNHLTSLKSRLNVGLSPGQIFSGLSASHIH
ncbi:hypothetical protein BJV77DRAFT_955093 [Russula vinacea]|nr:hypothetical protein BJV77DRAFT_955093 [Russula vinacea]